MCTHLACVHSNSGHSIKFQLFDTAQSYQCHFGEISTFVVSISRYMRAYFNYQALALGEEFVLPSDAAFLNCVALSDSLTYNDQPLYAKIGCRDRETYTSTRLQLHVYTDQQCSQPFDDGQTTREHAWRGYNIEGNRVSTKVSFQPEFYSCQSCAPDEISESFNKMNSNWYDDDYISHHGNKEAVNDDGDDAVDDAQTVDDQYYTAQDDANYQNNDDNNNNRQRRELLVEQVVDSGVLSVG